MKVAQISFLRYLWLVEVLTGLLFGLAAAAGATLFPGMQNMANVGVSLRAGRQAGYAFAAGLSVVFTIQAAVAVYFANALSRHPSIIAFMKQWAAFVFLFLAAVFLLKGFRARRLPVARPYQGIPFVRGMLLAGMNFLVIPYFFAISGYLLGDGYLDHGAASSTAFILAAGAGAMTVYRAYARGAHWIDRKAHFLTRNINFLLGGLLIILALVQGGRLYL